MASTAPVLIDLDRERIRRGRSQERWVPTREVCEHFGVSRRTISRWLNDPRYARGGRPVPHRKISDKDLRFQLGAVACWLDEGEIA